MTPAPRKTLIITDPVHQVMNFGSDPWIQKCLTEVIDTRSVQRLRRISQLGLASYVFPGATHTRFSHCLGAAHLAYTALTHLRERDEHKHHLKTSFAEVLIATVLHDVGHGPFSHSFERVLDSRTAPMHEDWTATIITDRASEVHRTLTKCGLSSERIASVFSKTPSGDSLPQYLRQVVSSQLDVDRMDYLVRDSHFAGVAVGRFDVHYLINSLLIIHHGHTGPRTLGLTPKGIKAYEAFILARQLMNRTVYYHHKVKVLEYMMEQFFRSVLECLSHLKLNATVSPHIPRYLTALKRLHTKEDSLAKKSFMQAHLGEYLELTEDRAWTLVALMASTADRKAEQPRRLSNMLLRRQLLPHWAVLPGKDSLLHDGLNEKGYRRNQHYGLVTLPTTMYKGTAEDKVFVRDWSGHIAEIPALSETIAALKDKPEVEALLIALDADSHDAICRIAVAMQAIQAPPRNTAAGHAARRMRRP